MKVPKFKLEFEDWFIERYKEGCEDILRSGRTLTNGMYVQQFEEQFAKWIGTRYAVAVGSGTDALEAILRALNVKGGKVVIPVNTMIATAIAVERAGAEFIPVDIEAETFSLLPTELNTALAKHEDIKAVIVVHIGGLISDHIRWITNICQENNIPLVEDSAHAHSSLLGGFHAGKIGIGGAFSFFPTKCMTTGEGGMITTDDVWLYEKLKCIREFGRDPADAHWHIMDGGNFKMTEFQALMGCLELERVDERINKRRQIACAYQRLLRRDKYRAVVSEGECSYYKQIVLLKANQNRNELKEYCKERGVELTGEVYPFLISEQPIYQERFCYCDYPIASNFSKSHICPPCYPELTMEEVKYACEVLNSYEKNMVQA